MTNDYITIEEAAGMLGKSERHIRRLCDTGKLSGAVKDGEGWRIPVTADSRFCRVKTPEQMTEAADLKNIQPKKREEAQKRLGIIQAFEKFAGQFVRGGGIRTAAMEAYCSQNRLAKRSLERWLTKYKLSGIVGLVDTRGGGAGCEMISPEAWELFKAMYLTMEQRTVKSCFQNISFINKDQGKNWQLPKLGFMYQYIDKNIPMPVLVLHREGMAAYEAKCAPYLQVDPDSIEPGQVWIGDHHEFNCWIWHRNRWIRPWITAWQDMRSRLPVGWHISAAPNQTTIMLAAKRGIEKYGPPDSVKIDNGKDYDSEMWTGTTKVRRRLLKKGYIDEAGVAGLYAMMDIGVSFSIPYHPQSKAIERWFDTLDKQFTKMMPTYCGKDTKRKPEDLADYLKTEKAMREACTIETFSVLVARYIEAFSNTCHSGAGMDDRTPNQVFATRRSRRVLPNGVLELIAKVWSGELIVGKNGVRFKDMWFGQFDMTLAAIQGKKVRIAYDPDDLRQVDIYDAATMKLVTIAEQAQLVRYGEAVSEDGVREAMKSKAHAAKVAKQFRDSRLTANMNLADLSIRAMEDAAREGTEAQRDKGTETLRPVLTPLNSQVRERGRQLAMKIVKKAAGAEGTREVLDMDLSVLAPDKRINLGLFTNGNE